MSSILARIADAARARVERERTECGEAALRAAVPGGREPFRFERALAKPGLSFICEVKKASPSKGIIAEEFPYLDIARAYEAAGAAAISVLTEPEFFLGSDRYLTEIRGAVDTPLLRKDFVVDRYQVVQAAALGADAVLLICAILTPRQLREYRELADELGLSCLVEAHDEGEVETALAAGARVIGVNNRDLHTFRVDTATSMRLRALVPGDVLFVSESGLHTRGDIAPLEACGVDAVLVGESLMRSPDKAAALSRLRGDRA